MLLNTAAPTCRLLLKVSQDRNAQLLLQCPCLPTCTAASVLKGMVRLIVIQASTNKPHILDPLVTLISIFISIYMPVPHYVPLTWAATSPSLTYQNAYPQSVLIWSLANSEPVCLHIMRCTNSECSPPYSTSWHKVKGQESMYRPSEICWTVLVAMSPKGVALL